MRPIILRSLLIVAIPSRVLTALVYQSIISCLISVFLSVDLSVGVQVCGSGSGLGMLLLFVCLLLLFVCLLRLYAFFLAFSLLALYGCVHRLIPLSSNDVSPSLRTIYQSKNACVYCVYLLNVRTYVCVYVWIQGSKEAEEYRRGLGVLQADLEMSSETLRAALSEAKGQLVSAKERNHRSHLQLSEKNTILERCDMYGVVCVCVYTVSLFAGGTI